MNCVVVFALQPTDYYSLCHFKWKKLLINKWGPEFTGKRMHVGGDKDDTFNIFSHGGGRRWKIRVILHQVAKIAFNFNNRRQWNWIQLIVAISELHLTQFPDTERELWLSVGLTVVYMESEEFLVNCWVCTSPYQLKLCNYILNGCREIDACLKGLWFIFIVHLIPVLAGLDLPLGLKLAKQPSAIMRTSKIKVCHLTSDLPQAIGFQVSGQNLN